MFNTHRMVYINIEIVYVYLLSPWQQRTVTGLCHRRSN